MIVIVLFVIVVILSFVFVSLGNKARKNFTFDKTPNENIIEVNEEVKFLRKNDTKSYNSGILYLTNKRLVFFKYRFAWLGVIPFIGDAFISIFIDKNVFVEIPIQQIIRTRFSPKITYREHGYSDEQGLTTFLTNQNDEYEFDIYVLGMAQGEKPAILTKLEQAQKSIDILGSFN
ncbi:MAG: hypothetical protein IPK18_06920 [Sphingobacteriales bacterium]|jgi:hypothetical protein|nr:MAG: hypothetical protein IPK18_06920 [Sphingobacteriales bacterium]